MGAWWKQEERGCDTGFLRGKLGKRIAFEITGVMEVAMWVLEDQ